MACQIFRYKQVIVVHWGTPEIRDLDACVDAVHETSLTEGKPVTFVAVVPADAPAPPEAVKKLIILRFKELLSHCESFHQVLLGEGFAIAAKRAVFAAIVLIGSERRKVHVHANLESVISKSDPKIRPDIGSAMRQFRAAAESLSVA